MVMDHFKDRTDVALGNRCWFNNSECEIPFHVYVCLVKYIRNLFTLRNRSKRQGKNSNIISKSIVTIKKIDCCVIYNICNFNAFL